ncbi:hypothetical protein [Xanthomonas arboricola]|uniref:hypothetical protein n=1 Tax=Xanthomonas arboricola TaxID=56448 RepID=UPI000ADF5A9E|nr:hypothetical protein [Xanthomonas arboricola]
MEKHFTREFKDQLSGYSAPEIYHWFKLTEWLVRNYTFSSQLDGPIYLTPDNNVIQDFKHREQPIRNLRRLAYTAFCRFAQSWSSRDVSVAISPVIVYEHIGRTPASLLASKTAIESLTHLLSNLRISLRGIAFDSPESLSERIGWVHGDAELISTWLKSLDGKSWAIRPSRNSDSFYAFVSDEVIPETTGLRYFDEWLIKKFLFSHIEKRIAEQSIKKYGASPIYLSERSQSISSLSEICKRRGILTGLGDLDFLQNCSLTQQHGARSGFVVLGQTFDKNLGEALQHHAQLIESGSIQFGSPDTEQQIAKFVEGIISPFKDESSRLKVCEDQALDFLSTAWDLCRSLIRQAPGYEPKN